MQKSGRLADASLDLLRQCGLHVSKSKNELYSRIEELPIDVLLVRDDNIPGFVSDGVCDLGIVGENVLREVELRNRPGFEVEVVMPLGFSRCRLVVAVPNFSSWQAKWSDADWFHLDPPRHLHHFSRDGLRQLVERTGFDCVSQHHFSLRQNPFGWIQSALNRMAGPDARPNRLYSFLQGIGPRAPCGSAIGFWLQLAIGALPALALSIAAAAFGRGATVHVVALRRESARAE